MIEEGALKGSTPSLARDVVCIINYRNCLNKYLPAAVVAALDSSASTPVPLRMTSPGELAM